MSSGRVPAPIPLWRRAFVYWQVHDGSYTPTEQFLKDPDSLCSTVSWRDEEDRVIWVYKVQVRAAWTGGKECAWRSLFARRGGGLRCDPSGSE